MHESTGSLSSIGILWDVFEASSSVCRTLGQQHVVSEDEHDHTSVENVHRRPSNPRRHGVVCDYRPCPTNASGPFCLFSTKR